MFAGGAGFALIDVVRTIHSFVSVGTGAHVGSIDGTRIADGASVARIGSASVIKMTQ